MKPTSLLTRFQQTHSFPTSRHRNRLHRFTLLHPPFLLCSPDHIPEQPKMDPLSIAASAIAITQAVAAIGAGVDKLRGVRNASAEFCDMLNELSILQEFLHQLRDMMENMTSPNSSIPSTAVHALEKLQLELSRIVNEISGICKEMSGTSTGLNLKGQQKVSKMSWQLKRGRIFKLRDRAKRCRESLAACVEVLGLSNQLHHRQLLVEVRDIIETTADTAESGFSQMANLFNSRFDELEAQLSSIARTRPDETLATSPARDTSSVAHLQTSVRQRCSRYCKCQCHTMSTIQTPRWMRPITGSFAAYYNSIPIFSPRTCDVVSCRSKTQKRLAVNLCFPSWFLQRSIEVTAVWGSLTNAGASLHLRVPRLTGLPFVMKAIRFHDINWLVRAV
ncbi:hypothetical protein B0H63DRAFT_194773 [Podospora didyma]|uniref:Fungal N-terminal domain-containing protein n=1 Tax=Podospora didyma TaxID=330526 RepID=A0AAE0TV90_9PEZI|nr:hypothetical protein B0H63DRAFT_194773 [Podospora didyma]